MTGRAYLLAALAFAALLFGMAAVFDSNSGSGTLIAIAIPILIYVAVGAFNRPSLPKLSAERTLARVLSANPWEILECQGGRVSFIPDISILFQALVIVQPTYARILSLA